MFSSISLLAAALMQATPVPVPPPIPAPPADPPPRTGSVAQRAQASESLSGLFTADDYPIAALRREAEGTVRFRLHVDRDGRVSRCTVTRSSGNSDLDKTTCRIARERARFRPARDRSGRAVEDVVNSQVRWALTDDEPAGMAFAAYRQVTSIIMAGDGSVRCRLEIDDQPPFDLPDPLCRGALDNPSLSIPPGGRGELTTIMALTPSGVAPVRSRSADYGTLLGEAEAEIEVASDGSISECRVTLLTGRAQEASDFCEFLQAGGPAFQPTGDGRRRTGRLRTSAYSRFVTAT